MFYVKVNHFHQNFGIFCKFEIVLSQIAIHLIFVCFLKILYEPH